MNIAEFLHLAYRQEIAFYKIGDLFKGLFTSGFSIKRFFAGILAIIECFGCVIFDKPVTPDGPALDLSGYELVLEDEFEGTELNTDIWEQRCAGARRSGFNGASQSKVFDGALHLTGEYLENGQYGAGWYGAMIALKEHYCKGYFEIRCKCSDSDDFWSAFWIQALGNPYDHYLSHGGINGCEIDIFEAMSADALLKKNREAVSSTIHCNGWDDDIENIDSRCLGEFKVKNLYTEFNTFGLKWTDDEYIFYINGIESARSSFGNGVCEVPEQVILSLEIPDAGITKDKDYKTDFVVDYIKVYQTK